MVIMALSCHLLLLSSFARGIYLTVFLSFTHFSCYYQVVTSNLKRCPSSYVMILIWHFLVRDVIQHEPQQMDACQL